MKEHFFRFERLLHCAPPPVSSADERHSLSGRDGEQLVELVLEANQLHENGEPQKHLSCLCPSPPLVHSSTPTPPPPLPPYSASPSRAGGGL